MRPNQALPIGENTASDQQLSQKEQSILELVARGLTNREIARKLSVTLRTVERNRAAVMRKLGLHNQGELIDYAVRHGILRRDS